MAGFVIVRMSPEDAGAVAALEREIFSDAWGEDGIREELEDDLYVGYLALGETQYRDPGGYVLTRIVAGEGEILRVGVLPKYRRRGVARQLLQQLFSKSLRQKPTQALNPADTWFLEVREHNASAIALYRSFGFYDIGLRKGYYHDTGEAALLMRKDVDFDR